MRIGTLAYRTETGLGYQAKSYVDHLGVDKVLVVDLSRYNGIPLNNWYPGTQTVVGYPKEADLIRFLTDLDVVILAETPLNYDLYRLARERGIRTVVVINWEFFDYYQHPDYPKPDVIIMPSVWYYQAAKEWCDANGVECYQLHHPVDTDVFTPRLRNTKKFIHIAGKPATNDRNGTWEYLQAVPDGTVVTQSHELARHIAMRYRHSRVHTNIKDATQMYHLGDILVFPRRYGGNCLPLNEALASGMPVIMPDISPNNHLLPSEWLVPANIVDSFTPRTKIDLYSVEQAALYEKLEWFRRCNIEEESQKAIDIAQTISWNALKDKYLEILCAS